MSRPLLAALALLLTLTACGQVRESRINPLNWFGRSEARPTAPLGQPIPVLPDTRPLVDQVTAMSLERTHGGAILRATGLPPTQGFWDAELVAVTGANVGEGVLVFDFRLAPPPYLARQGTTFSREVEVATFLSNAQLEGVSRIVVRGLRTERVSGR
jgi:hypothetical protein